jgi:diguanylate cyclase (GGDEF)-like protein
MEFVTKPYEPVVIKHRIEHIISLKDNATFIHNLERDSLTGVYNRDAFYLHAKEFIVNSPFPVDIVVTDIDDFKLVNDMFTEKMGDRMLKKWCSILSHTYPMSGGIIGRLTGDIFAIVMPRVEVYKEEYFNSAISELNGCLTALSLNIHFGIYQVEGEDIPVSVMCDRAIIAIRSIKEGYKKCFAFYDAELREQLWKEQIIISEMKEAMLEGQFKVYLQPKCELVSQKIVGAEALVRWIHPIKGMMSPAEFIPVFEKNGFITDLDEYVWEQTCVIIRRWLDKGITVVPVSVNVSRVDIYNTRLVDILCGLVEKYNLSYDMLHLEITETAYTENPKQLIDTVVKLRACGFTIEMDDFGAGYSSLIMLAKVPVDTLKLDMGFIRELTVDNSIKSGNILNFVVELAKWLDLAVIAEGVETKEQLEFLKSLSCRYGQGYYFSKPVPVDVFERLMTDKNISPYLPAEELQQVGQLKLHEIWVPDSHFNIVFNDYLGALGIVESVEGKFKLVRANNYCFELLNGKEENELYTANNLYDYISKEDLPAFIEDVRKASTETNSFSNIYKWNINGKQVDIMCRGKVIGRSEGNSRVLFIIDVTNASEIADAVSKRG